jgi:peptidyl-prolyl cis-trans isomerase C
MRMAFLSMVIATFVFNSSAGAQNIGAPKTGNPNTVIATINGIEIRMSRLEQALDAYANDLGQLDPKSFYFAVLDRIIDQELAAQAAVKSGIADDPAIKAEVANAQSSILAGAHLNHVASKATSDSELLRRYEEMKKSGVKSVRARHILVKTSEEAEDLITQLQNGADFGELAKAYSVGPSGPSGGDLGFFGPGQMVKPFQDAAFSLEKGAHTISPVKTRFGFHVIKVEDIRSESPPPFEQAKQQLVQEARTQAMIKELEVLHSASEIRRFAPDGSEVGPNKNP